MLKDVNYKKEYYAKRENVVMKYVKKNNIDQRKLQEKFFDGLHQTFIDQSKFVNVQRVMEKITDQKELKNQAT